MIYAFIAVLVVIVGLALFYVIFTSLKKPKEQRPFGSVGVEKNKKQIQSMVANVESIIIYANGNDELCRRLVEVKENIRFFNPSTNDKVLLVDSKLANRLDDLKIMTAKDKNQETCFRVLEEIEAFVVQRKKEEQAG